MSRRDFISKFGPVLPVAAVAAVGLPRVARADDLPTFEANLANSADQTKGAALVGFLQNGAAAVGRTAFSKFTDVVSVRDFGAKGDGNDPTGNSDTPAFLAALAYVASIRGHVQGGVVYVPAGLYYINQSLALGDFVQLVGDGIGSELAAGSSFPAGQTSLLSIGNSSNVFGTRIVGLTVNQHGATGLTKAVIYSNSMNELCGLFNVLITNVSGTDGVLFEAGPGVDGPSLVELNNVSISTTAGNGVSGVHSNVGGMILKASHLTIQGNSSSHFTRGVFMESDVLCAEAVHFENCVVGIDFSTNSYGGRVSVLTASHMGPASPCLIGIDSTFSKGTVHAENLLVYDQTSAVLIENDANGYRTPSALKTYWASYTYSPGTVSTTVSQP